MPAGGLSTAPSCARLMSLDEGQATAESEEELCGEFVAPHVKIETNGEHDFLVHLVTGERRKLPGGAGGWRFAFNVPLCSLLFATFTFVDVTLLQYCGNVVPRVGVSLFCCLLPF